MRLMWYNKKWNTQRFKTAKKLFEHLRHLIRDGFDVMVYFK